MSTSPFSKLTKTSSSTNHNVVARDNHLNVLPPSRRSKIELPGSNERHNYIEIQTRSGNQSNPIVLDLPSIGIKVQNGSNTHNKSIRQQNASEEECLLTLALKRLHTLKGQLDLSKLELGEAHEGAKRKDNTIKELKLELSKMEAKVNKPKPEADPSKIVLAVSEYHDLLDRCCDLENQVSEMETFFQDYGLTFVGDHGSAEDVISQPPDRLSIDFNKLVRNIEMLNVYAREGESQMVLTNQGASFKMPESVPLVLYSNGMVLFSGPFRDYNDIDTEMFIRDLLDGFFPSELQRSYPDGVPFKVVDKRNVIYQDQRLIFKAFGGTGHRLGRAEPSSTSTSSVEDEKPVNINIIRLSDQGHAKHPRINEKTNTNRKDEEPRTSLSERCIQMGEDRHYMRTNLVESDSSIFNCAGNNSGKKLGLRLNKKLDRPNRTSNEAKAKRSEESGLNNVRKDENEEMLRREYGDVHRTVSDTHVREIFQEEYFKRLLKNSNRSSNNSSFESVMDGVAAYEAARDRIFSPNHLLRSASKCSMKTYKNGSNGDLDLKQAQDLDSKRNLTNKMRIEKNLKTKPISAENFLKKLPAVVIRNGKIVDIRGELSEFCKDTKQCVNKIHIKKDVVDPVIQLKIKANGGNDLLLVDISPNRTIGELRTCIYKTIDEETKRTGYELYVFSGASNKYVPLCYYYRKLSDCGLDCDLTNNAMLYLVPESKDN